MNRALIPIALMLFAAVLVYAAEPAAVTKTAPAVQTPDAKAPESADMPAPRDAKWLARHELFVREAAKSAGDILFLGDEITEGWRNNNLIWDQFYARNSLAFGIVGDTTQNLLWRITNGELNGIKPKVVVILIGTNNTGADSAETIAGGITGVVTNVHAKLPDSKILLLGVFPRGPIAKHPLRDKIAAINTQVAKLDNGSTILFRDLGSVFLAPDGSITKDVMFDFVHLTVKGYDLWADAMNPTLSEMLGKKIERVEKK